MTIHLRSLQATAQDLERQRATDSLKKGLQHRPERDELIERKGPTISPLSRSVVEFIEEIVGNILPDSTAAPALLAHQKDLEKQMRADALNEKIAHRPDPGELVKEGILERK